MERCWFWGVRVSNEGTDAGQLALDIDALPRQLGPVTTVLADTGYANGSTIQKLQGKGIEVLVAMGRQTDSGHRRHDFRPVPEQMGNQGTGSEMEQALGPWPGSRLWSPTGAGTSTA